MRVKMLMAAAAAVGLIGAAPAPKPAAPPSAPTGYLGEAMPNIYRILPPAPTPGTTRWEADRTIYLSTRKLEGGPRWSMAQGDVNSAAILKDLSCAIGVELTRENAPRTSALISRVGLDVARATNQVKDIYKRPRPFLTDDGPTCIPKDAALSASPDYPSGHNAWGWGVGLLMAELAPDRATEILSRARAFGEGRLVCGVHTLSAVEAGRLNGSVLVAALHGQEAFRKDLEVARKEVEAARKAGPAPDPAACAAEAELVAKSPY